MAENNFMRVPVNLAELDVRAILGVEPVVDRNGEHESNWDGVPLWQLLVTAKFGREYNTIEIQFPSETDPGWDGHAQPIVHGLTTLPTAWLSETRSGKKKLGTGMMWSATSVEFTPTNTKTAAASTGNGKGNGERQEVTA